MDNQEEEFEKLQQKVKKIEGLLEKILSNKEVSFVNIEQLDIKGPILEFKFDGIDVEEVSGSLNVGINLGVPADESTNSKSTKSNGVKENTETPSTKDSKDSNSPTKTAAEGHHAKFSEIENHIDEKLKELFPKNLNKPEQETSNAKQTSPTNSNIKNSNKHKDSNNTVDEENNRSVQTKEETPINVEQQLSETPVVDKSPTYIQNSPSNNAPTFKNKRIPKRNKQKALKEEIDGKDHHITKSATGFSYQFQRDM